MQQFTCLPISTVNLSTCILSKLYLSALPFSPPPIYHVYLSTCPHFTLPLTVLKMNYCLTTIILGPPMDTLTSPFFFVLIKKIRDVIFLDSYYIKFKKIYLPIVHLVYLSTCLLIHLFNCHQLFSILLLKRTNIAFTFMYMVIPIGVNTDIIA